MVIEFLLEVWWNPILKDPVEFGILKKCKLDEFSQSNIETIVKFINAIFYQKQLNDFVNIFPFVNKYILSYL